MRPRPYGYAEDGIEVELVRGFDGAGGRVGGGARIAAAGRRGEPVRCVGVRIAGRAGRDARGTEIVQEGAGGVDGEGGAGAEEVAASIRGVYGVGFFGTMTV